MTDLSKSKSRLINPKPNMQVFTESKQTNGDKHDCDKHKSYNQLLKKRNVSVSRTVNHCNYLPPTERPVVCQPGGYSSRHRHILQYGLREPTS